MNVSGCAAATDHGGVADAAATDADSAGQPYATAVIHFTPGANAGFGADAMPEVVLGPPRGAGNSAGGLDVVSLGKGGVIVLKLGLEAVDRPGPDLLVFENAFVGFVETGVVAVSADGETWHEFPCASDATDDAFPGCAGVTPVLANPQTGVSATNPAVAGGDAFDLADIGVSSARYVRVSDTGQNVYEGKSGGFDLDAIAVVVD